MPEASSGKGFLTKESGEPYAEEEIMAFMEAFRERFEHPDPNDPEAIELQNYLQSVIEAQRHARNNEGHLVILGRCGVVLSQAGRRIHDYLTPSADTSYEYALPYGFVTGPSDSTALALDILEEFHVYAADDKNPPGY